MKQYAVAYLDHDGSGFSTTEPYILDDINSIEEGKKIRNELGYSGLRRVTLFWYENELPECVTWHYVLEHKIYE